MARMKVAFLDDDQVYRERFLAYLMNYKGNELEVSTFTNKQFLYEALCVDKFQLIILGCGYEEILRQIKKYHIPTIVLLESGESYIREPVAGEEESVIYTSKYQSMDIITKQMRLVMETGGELGKKQHEVELIVVFSPVKHEMQMLLSLLYAKNLSREQKVLYLNTQEFSGFEEIFGETEFDFGEIILKLREGNIKSQNLLECIYEGDGFSYISPFINPGNVRDLNAADICHLLDAVEKYTDFQTVVWDMGTSISGFEEVLSVCSKLYCIGKKGYLSEAQIHQFFSYLEKIVDEDSLRKVRQIEIPGQIKVLCGGVNLLEKLDWGEFGDFVRMKM